MTTKQPTVKDTTKDTIKDITTVIPKDMQEEFAKSDAMVFDIQNKERRKKKLEYNSTMTLPVGATEDDDMLPRKVYRLHGCMGCEWKHQRYNWMCPLKLTKSDARIHTNGICFERKQYLKAFSQGYDKRPTYYRWHRDWMVNRAAFFERKEWMEIETLDRELQQLRDKTLTDINDPKEYKCLLKQKSDDLDNAKKRWHLLWRDITTFQDKQVERETVKKIETVERKAFTLSDINKVVREYDKDEIVEANYEIIEEDKEDA